MVFSDTYRIFMKSNKAVSHSLLCFFTISIAWKCCFLFIFMVALQGNGADVVVSILCTLISLFSFLVSPFFIIFHRQDMLLWRCVLRSILNLILFAPQNLVGEYIRFLFRPEQIFTRLDKANQNHFIDKRCEIFARRKKWPKCTIEARQSCQTEQTQRWTSRKKNGIKNQTLWM